MESIDLLWLHFKKENSQIAKEKLIFHYLPYVNQIINRVKMSLPKSVVKEELFSYGIFGLYDAMSKFDLSRGFKFETYAFPRIKGAIIDGLRAEDWLPLSIRQEEKKLVKVIGELEQELGRTATDQEIAAQLKMDSKDLHNLLDKLCCTNLVSLDQLFNQEGEESVSLLERLRGNPEREPENIISCNEIKNVLIEAINKLPEKEKLVIALYYYEGLNLKEISKVVDLSESRISQLHTKAIFRLRGRLSRQKKALL
jgi:RNA polymerase sigma factor for flagellar operon FliA